MATQHQYIQAAVDQHDQNTQATVDVNEGSVQATEETVDQSTLTDVSNTTGTRLADAQTEFAMEDAEHQHGPSHNDFTETGTETVPYTAETEAEKLYDLTDFALEADGTLHRCISTCSISGIQ